MIFECDPVSYLNIELFKTILNPCECLVVNVADDVFSQVQSLHVKSFERSRWQLSDTEICSLEII